MSQSEVVARERFAVLAITVWFEAGHESGFRARISAVDEGGGMTVLGVTHQPEEVTDLVSGWLASLSGN